MRRERLVRAIVLLVTAALLAVPSMGVGAAQLLLNPGLDGWADGAPANWAASGAQPTGSFSSEGWLQQVAGPLAGGTPYTARVVSSGSGSVRLNLAWLSEGYTALGTHTTSEPAGGTLTFNATAPAEARYVRFKVSASPDGGPITIESVSLDGAAAPPTSAPTATFTVAPPSPTRPPTSAPLSATPGRTATRTPTKTATTTPGASPSATQPGSTAGATATAQPSNTAEPSATSEPTVLPPGYGGLIANGNFERVEDGRPYAWAKFGGTMTVSGDAYRGDWALSLASDGGGTRWVHQAAPVTAGQWYAASAVARVSGGGEAFIRLSWYASADGSGAALDQVDGTLTSGGGWTGLQTVGLAPAGARSVRVRLMLRAGGDATAYFDDASLGITSAPAATPTRAPATSGRGGGRGGGAGGAVIQGFAAVPYDGPRTLAISEVLADPAEDGRDAPYEWVELVNYGTEPVTLSGWHLGDARELDPLPAVDVPPGGYLIIAAPSAQLPPVATTVVVADGVIGAGLNNDGDAVRLAAPDGELIDAMSFGEDTSVFEPAPPAPEAGGTIAVRIPGADPDASNWGLSVAPSPGQPNAFPAATPTPEPSASASAAEPGDRTGDDGPTIEDEERDSPLPLILLGGAGGAGLVGIVLGARRAWPSVQARLPRGR